MGHSIMEKTQENLDFSIVTIVNNPEVFDGFCRSLETQTAIRYELIPIYNLHGEFHSARAAYNSVLDTCRGEYILFTHPDIRFEAPAVLSSLKNDLDRLGTFGIVGAAGAAADKENVHRRILYSSMLHGKDKRAAGAAVHGPQPVQTVDECFFVAESAYILANRFPDADGWHLYAVELCLESLLKQKTNYVLPMDLWHISDGRSLDANYVYQLERIIRLYGSQFPVLYTTVRIWKTRGLAAAVYRRYYALKQKIKKVLGR